MSLFEPIANTHPERAALFFGHPDETWCEALDRFERFTTAVVDDWFDEDTGSAHEVRLSDQFGPDELLLRHAPLADSVIADLESRHQVVLPAELVSLLTGHGGFALSPDDPHTHFGFFASSRPEYPRVKNLRSAMVFYGLSGFLDTHVPADLLARMERDFFCFATANFVDANMAFLLFDRAGRFAIFDYEDHDEAYSLQGLMALQDLSGDGVRLDDVLRRCVNWSIFSLLRRAGVAVDEFPDWRDNWRSIFPIGAGVDTPVVWQHRIP